MTTAFSFSQANEPLVVGDGIEIEIGIVIVEGSVVNEDIGEREQQITCRIIVISDFGANEKFQFSCVDQLQMYVLCVLVVVRGGGRALANAKRLI